MNAENLPRLMPRPVASHKGDFGRALLIGGSRGMAGAIALTGMAALRAGAGLVTLAVPDCCLSTVAGFEPCYMTVPLPSSADGQMAISSRSILEEQVAGASIVACGPGLGRGPSLTDLVHGLYQSVTQSMVVDADALNGLAAHDQGIARPGGPRILTPHPGELRRLLRDPKLPGNQLADRAIALAAEHQIVVVLKGHRTLVTDGHRTQRNETGNPGMATGGSGDVLTGVIAALLAQGLPPWEAARLGVHLHGLSGDLAAQQLTQFGLIARDLIRFLPDALQQVAP